MSLYIDLVNYICEPTEQLKQYLDQPFSRDEYAALPIELIWKLAQIRGCPSTLEGLMNSSSGIIVQRPECAIRTRYQDHLEAVRQNHLAKKEPRIPGFKDRLDELNKRFVFWFRPENFLPFKILEFRALYFTYCEYYTYEHEMAQTLITMSKGISN